MKVTLKYNMSTYSGTLNDMTYANYRDGAVCIGRRYVTPRETVQHTNMAAVAHNLADVYMDCDPAYLQDLKDYAVKYGKEVCSRNQLPPNAYGIWLKMMYAWKKLDPQHVFLDSLTLDDIVSLEAPVMTISEAVDSDLLPRTSNAGLLVAPIDGV